MENLIKKIFLEEKNPTSTFKIRGFGGQKSFSDFFLEINCRWKKFAVFWKICEKLFLVKKSNLKFENPGFFEKKKSKSP